jgi:hypothetical protein
MPPSFRSQYVTLTKLSIRRRKSGTKPVVVYFPASKYVVSNTIRIHSTTLVIGDASYPEVVVTANFAGDAVFNTPANVFGHVRKLQVKQRPLVTKRLSVESYSAVGREAVYMMWSGMARSLVILRVRQGVLVNVLWFEYVYLMLI